MASVEVETHSADSSSSRSNPRAACTNCRSSHVACSHEIPCSRCVSHGLAASCVYLPRKRRTDFKKSKVESEFKRKRVDTSQQQQQSEKIASLIEQTGRYETIVPTNKQQQIIDADAEEEEEEVVITPQRLPHFAPTVLPPMEFSPDMMNSGLSQVFGDEYPFPLVDTNVLNVEQFDQDLIESTEEFLIPGAINTTWVHSQPMPAAMMQQQMTFIHNQQQQYQFQPQHMIPAVTSFNPQRFLGYAQTSDSEGNSSSPSSSTSPSSPSSDDQSPSSSSSASLFLASSPSLSDDITSSSSSSLSAPLSLTGISNSTSLLSLPSSPAQITSASTSSKALRMLHDLKQKNERLEQMLLRAMSDIKVMKEREVMYQGLVSNFMRDETKSNQHLFPLAAAREFDQLGIPGIAMFTLTGKTPYQIVQCNQTFQAIVGRSWNELNEGFTCCQMFPARILPMVSRSCTSVASAEGPYSAEGELIVARPNGDELPVKAYSHIIFDSAGAPLFKMFYVFML